ncbi:MAG: ADP-ribosylglycohydrolase family protein [Deltaproteobacteria bacterium]|nr:ADP-ribosylglycohydrolase family protein [Deltaproteobacteria bacterium]
MSISKDKLASHFIGSALGGFMGDALGMAVEGWPSWAIQREFGLLSDLMPGRFPAGCYTDDTEMMISLLESIVAEGGLMPGKVAARFLANFHPERGYGGRIYGIMDQLAAGVPWERVGTDSFGNGSAMRVAPVGFFYYDDLARVKEAAVAQAAITHRHPQALAGAVIQAGAVALALKAGLEDRRIETESFLSTLAELSQDLDQRSAARLLALLDLELGPIPELIPRIQALFRCDVRAIEAVPPAVASFLLTDDYVSAITLAVNLGGDTDTLGAMSGAVAGAHYGEKGLPRPWLERLENGPLGRDYVIDLCRQAAQLKIDKGRSSMN